MTVRTGAGDGARTDMYHPANLTRKAESKHLHQPPEMRKTCSMNRRFFSEESKKKLWRPCREARALGL